MTGEIELVWSQQAPILAAIHRAAFPPGEAWSSNVIELQLAVPGAFGLLDQRGGMILARVAADEAEVVTLAVAPGMRRRGLAQGLLGAAKEHARRQGAAAMFLEVDVANVGARALYSRLGFTKVGKRRGYYANGSDALVMRVDLEPSERPTSPAGAAGG
jgi:ribosomal-protein-alanine N-acetyltransferase